jgi:hypothetical protein
VTAADIVAWQPVGVLIIDEISFVGRKKLARLEQRLRRLKNNQVLFGGVHVILAGDLYQLKGQEKAVYANPEQDEKKTLSDTTGFLPWTESLNCGIELAENFRAKEDPNYAALLDRMRTNEPLLEDIQFINKHVMSAQRPVPGGAFLAAATNKERRAINEQLFYRYLLQNYSTAESSWRARSDSNISEY